MGDREPRSPMFYIGVYAAVRTYQFRRSSISSHLSAPRSLLSVRSPVAACTRWFLIRLIKRSHPDDYPLVYTLFVLRQHPRYALC